MEIRVKVPDELATQAQARGVPVEAYVEQLLAQQVTMSSGTMQARTPEQVRAWLDSLAQFSEKIPSLPEIISREWIYQDHTKWPLLRV
jgi:post-segregation antitoxin (ccd killing protein)